jgi:hypothetical protein
LSVNLIGRRVYLSFHDPDGERGPYGVPFGAFAGTIHSHYEGQHGSIGYYVALDEFLLLHRDGAEIRGEIVGVSPCGEGVGPQSDPIADAIGSSGKATGDALVIRSSVFPKAISRDMMVADASKPSSGRQFFYFGIAEVTTRHSGSPPPKP